MSTTDAHNDSRSEDDRPGDPSREKSPTGSQSGGELPPGGRPAEIGTVTDEEWKRLRAPFTVRAYDAVPRTQVPTPEGDRTKAVVDLMLRRVAIQDRLDTVLGPGRYGYHMELASGPETVRCILQVGTVSRAGLGKDQSLRSAQGIALARAAKGFGIGQSGRAAGPVLAYVNNRYEIPKETTRRIEGRDDPSDWTPEGGALRS